MLTRVCVGLRLGHRLASKEIRGARASGELLLYYYHTEKVESINVCLES